MTGLWHGTVWLLVVLATLGVLLGFGAPWSEVLDVVSYFRPHFGGLAAVGAMLALWLPRWRIKWIGFGAAALAVATLGPVWRSVERPVSGASQVQTVTVMTANILGARNPSLDLTGSVLVAADADILATMETPGAWRDPQSPLGKHYPYNTIERKPHTGVIIWSKFPLRQIESSHATKSRPGYATVMAELGGGAGFGVTAIHMSWPIVADGAQAKQIEAARSLLSATSGPKLLMGDFNAPPWSQAMKRVEETTRLSVIGGLRRTWIGGYPNPLQYLLTGSRYGREIPAVLGHHIDHILPSREVGVAQIEVIPLPGSDHRAVWARLRVPLRSSGTLFAGG